jgi:hypothetical protein
VHSLFSCAYFAPNLCDKQALDFMGLKNCRKTYPLRNERQKNRRRFGGLYHFNGMVAPFLNGIKSAKVGVFIIHRKRGDQYEHYYNRD